ncbi:MAG: transcriptional repressor [Acholeplasmatales bacterium]|nr:transcriptional repressor [Acholeplasmatales bacterium]
MRGEYKTKTKEIVNNEIKEIKNGFTIKELKERLDKKNVKIGLTTLYRVLEDLESKEIVKKYYDDENIAHFKYLIDCQSESHFYLKCNRCNKIVHIDCDCINEFYSHVLKKHKFSIETSNLIIPGICNDCKSFIKL